MSHRELTFNNQQVDVIGRSVHGMSENYVRKDELIDRSKCNDLDG